MQEEADGEDRRQEDAVGNKSSADLWTIRIVPPFSDDSSDERETVEGRQAGSLVSVTCMVFYIVTC